VSTSGESPTTSTVSLTAPSCGSSRSAYSPAASVTASRENAVPRFVAVTVAPGTTAPCASLTLPRMVAVGSCATAGDANTMAPSAAARNCPILE
jgi:hypothetical protein